MMSDINWREVLKAFCEQEDSVRYAVNEPWVKGGVMYATDCRIAVSVPAMTELDSPNDKRKRPDIARLFKDVAAIDASTPWPVEFADCEKCGQSGETVTYYRTCKRCDGEGTQECDLGHEHDCRKCRGTGRHECKAAGEGIESEVVSCGCNITFGDHTYDRRYIKLITDKLPGPLMWGQGEFYLKIAGADGVTAVLCPRISASM